MLKYLTILLDETDPSFCHYENKHSDPRLIELETLKQSIFWAMKENLMIQFVYPDYDLPQEYLDAIETIDHFNICSVKNKQVKADVVIGWITETTEAVVVLRLTKTELFAQHTRIVALLEKTPKINVVITDVETMTEADFAQYKQELGELAKGVEQLYFTGKNPQLNLLTDRMLLENPNHCNAGWESITIGADGRFYVCPGFYGEASVGDVWNGLDIKNPQLYRLDHAPICRVCDAHHCKRCIYLNKKMTNEVNTPSHEQCVAAHLERNASRDLLHSIREKGEFLPEKDINEINYLDPFEIATQWK